MNAPSSKTCNRCGNEKPTDGFHRDKRSRDGHSGRCKECAIEVVTAWQRDNPERARANRQSWATANPDKVRESQRASRARNSDARTAYDSAWAAANPEKARAKSARWKKRNPEKAFVLGLRKRAARRGSTLSRQVEAEIRDWHRIVMADPCPYTRQRVGCDHMDHIVPVAVGGEDAWWNLIGASASANYRKSDRSLLHFLLNDLPSPQTNRGRDSDQSDPASKGDTSNGITQ